MSRSAADRLISQNVVTDRVKSLEKWLKEQKPFALPQAQATGEYMLEELRDAVKQAAEVYRSTSETVRMTGWDRKTLLRHAHAALGGERLPRGWGGLQVRKEGSGYSFMVSTVPVRHRQSA